MRRLIWLPVAGFLLIAGAAAAAATPAVVNTATAALNMPAVAGSVLADVLADLVGDGTITQQQSDAITDAVDTKIEETRAEKQQRHEEMRAVRKQLRSFLEDEVITQDELDQLPADHPLRSLETALDDGQIALDELNDLNGSVRGFGRGRPHGGPHGGGGGWGHRFQGPGEWLSPDDADRETDTDADAESTQPNS
jgi:hypothetical protein